MGGWMDYQRVRDRNGLKRKPLGDPDPYWRAPGLGQHPLIAGDLNRMERDYLVPKYPKPPFAERERDSDPATQCALATGVDVAIVRRILRYVFWGTIEEAPR